MHVCVHVCVDKESQIKTLVLKEKKELKTCEVKIVRNRKRYSKG